MKSLFSKLTKKMTAPFISILLLGLICNVELFGQSRKHGSNQSIEFFEYIQSDNKLEDKIEYANNGASQLSNIFSYLNTNLSSTDSLYETLKKFAHEITNISPRTSFLIAEKLLELSKFNQDTTKMAETYLLTGMTIRDLGEYQTALEYLFNSLELTDENVDQLSYAGTLNVIASIYSDLGEFESSIEYYHEVLAIAESYRNKSLATTILLNIATPYAMTGEIDTAIFYLEKALGQAKSTGNKTIEAYAQSNLAHIFMEQGEPKKGIEYQSRGLLIEEALNDKLAMIDSHGVLAICYQSIQDKRMFKHHMNQSLSLALELNASEKLLDVYLYSAKGYGDFGDFRSAYKNSVLYHELYDSLHNLQKNDQVAEMREKYETEKKETEIINLQKDNQLASLEIDKEKNQKIIFIIAAVLFLVIAISGFLFFYQTKKSKEEVEARNELITNINKKLSKSQDALLESNRTKDKFFALIAHDLRGPITSFQGIGRMLQFSLKKNKIEKAEGLIESIDKSANGINILLDNLLKWSLSQTGTLPFKPEPLNLKVIAEDTFTIYEQSCQAKDIVLSNLITEDHWVTADHNTVSTVLRNLVGNAFKFTSVGGRISVDCKKNSKFYELIVSDNGIGIPKEKLQEIFELDDNKTTSGTQGEKGTGLGLMLCKEFITKNNGEISIESELGNGTLVTFSLPLLSHHSIVKPQNIIEKAV